MEQKTEEKIRDAPGTQPKTEPPDQLMDILLVMDMEKKTISVAGKGDKNDKKAKTVPLDKKHENDFLKINKSNILESFISNYLSQAKDPTHFRFFRMPLHAAKSAAHLFRDLAGEKPSEKALEIARQYEIKPENVKEKNQNTLKNNQMEVNQESTKTQTQPAQDNRPSQNRFQEQMINWDEMNKFGISREYLKEKGLLDDMLKGYKSREAVPISMNFGSVILRTDARLSLQQSTTGPVVLAVHGIRKEPDLDRPYFGHNFTDEDKRNLRETGNMGRAVMMAVRGSDEKQPYLISIDKITNEIHGTRADKVFLPDEICKVKLSDAEKADLREGKKVYIEGMTSKAGKEFSANVQINAEKRGVEFMFDENKQFNRQEIGGVKLTDKQVEALNTGKAIFVEDMNTKKGEKFSSFIKLNDRGIPQYTRYNPDTPEGAREIYIPKEIGGVRLTAEDRDELRAGKPVFIDGMVNRKGEEYSSFVKFDSETGIPQFSKTPDGFNERPQFKIPQEVWGVQLSATQRAGLQDGKAVYVENMKGYNGDFSSWLKVNENQGKLDYYKENPDMKKETGQNQAEGKQQDNSRKADSEEKKENREKKQDTTKSRSRKVS